MFNFMTHKEAPFLCNDLKKNQNYMNMNYYYIKIIYACVRPRENENIHAKIIRGIFIFLKILFKEKQQKPQTSDPVSSCKRFCKEQHTGSHDKNFYPFP